MHEDLAPTGYEVASDVEFTISDTGDVQKVTMKDEPKRVIIKTGDNTQVGLYVVMIAVAGIGMIAALKSKKKKECENE